MTKSGIGTTATTTTMTNAGTLTNSTVNTNGGGTLPSATSASQIASAEIPIWVADKKKWVTGISKRTTVNDLIYAILKQCQIVGQPQQQQQQLSNGAETSQSIAAQYVFVEYQYDPCFDYQQQQSTNGEHQQQQQPQPATFKIIDGESKVYKHLNKWSQSTTSASPSSNIVLKILQRQPLTSETNGESSAGQHTHNSTSLASKLLKKFGVSSSSSNSPGGSNSQPSSHSQSSSNLHASSFRYVDVKLPKPANTYGNSPATNTNNNSTSTGTLNKSSSSNGAPTTPASSRNFDPNIQKSFIQNTIMERESRLKQQKERFQIIDEMIRETEKKYKNQSNQLLDGGGATASPGSISPQPQPQPQQQQQAANLLQQQLNLKQLNLIDLNDIYCHFPEMCTHNLTEVEDFQRMCCQLFQLDEIIKNQKQVLTNLELDLQRELNANSLSSAANTAASSIAVTYPINNTAANVCVSATSPTNVVESPETVELRKEVNASREQTRLQCKQLHDLDAKMRLNEQNLMMREQQYQQLLEELYIQEIYADNALEKALVNVDYVAQPPPTCVTPQPTDKLVLNDDDDEANNSSGHMELKIINNDFGSNERPKFVDELFILNNQSDLGQVCNQLNMVKNSYRPAPFNPTVQLSTQQKSLSYGNLSTTNPAAVAETHPVEQFLQNHHQLNNHHYVHQSPPTQYQPIINNNNNKVTNLNPAMMSKLKTSPSLELNSAATKGLMNKLSATQNGQTNGGADHSGDNDSGISSMSSETTAITTTSSSSSSSSTSTTVTNKQPSTQPTSLQIQSSMNTNGVNSIPIVVNNSSSSVYLKPNRHMYTSQPLNPIQTQQHIAYQHQLQQQQQQHLAKQHQQQQQQSQVKSVLETLV